MKKLLALFFFCIFAQQGFSQFTVSQITYAPDSFNQGNVITIYDDQFSGMIQMPFSFCFFGNVYNRLTIGSNGIISFDTTYANGYCQWPIGTGVPSPTLTRNSIMMPMQDLLSDSLNHFYYITYGSAPNRRFVVSVYHSWMYGCPTDTFTGEVMLYESSNVIEIHIQNKGLCAGWNSGRAIEGVQNATGTQAFIVPGRNHPTQWTASNDAWRFTPSGCPTGIESSVTNTLLTIYPNPASNEIHISYTNVNTENFSVELMDVNGRIIYRDNFSAQNERIINPNASAGIYFVRLLNENGETLALRKLAME